MLKNLYALIVLSLVLLPSLLQAAPPRPIPEPPDLPVKSYILMDYESGKVLAEKNADMRVEPASITKLMTAYLVDKALTDGDIRLDDQVTISEKAWKMKGSKMFVEVGDKVTVENLIKGMIIQSGNDATVALAEYVAGSEDAFVGYMNHQARQLGMSNTQFRNSTGWPDKEHYSTARDIATLARAVIRDYPMTYKYYKEKEFTWNNIRQFNRNRLLWKDPSVDGLKTGHTDAAGYCLVASAKRDGMRLISVVLGAKSDKARTINSQALLNYGFRFFEAPKLYEAGQALKTVRVWFGDKDRLALGVEEPVSVLIPKGRYKDLKAAIEINANIEAPIAKGKELGKLSVRLDDETVVTRPLVALQEVKDGGLVKKAMDSVKKLFE